MSARADFATHFSRALRAPGFACPPGLKAWNGSDPAKRFGVYRNNVMVSLVDALADSYPVVQALVGEDFFRAMAREFVHQSPPCSPVLAWYGADFPDFVSTFPPAAGLPWLADVARLEWLRVEAWHAADADALPSAALSALLGNVEQLPAARFTLHPALRILRSSYPVVSIWDAHRSDDPGQAEAALLMRPGLDVEIVPIPCAAADFVACLHQGMPFGQAVDAAPCDIAATLAVLIRSEALTGIQFAEEDL